MRDYNQLDTWIDSFGMILDRILDDVQLAQGYGKLPLSMYIDHLNNQVNVLHAAKSMAKIRQALNDYHNQTTNYQDDRGCRQQERHR